MQHCTSIRSSMLVLLVLLISTSTTYASPKPNINHPSTLSATSTKSELPGPKSEIKQRCLKCFKSPVYLRKCILGSTTCEPKPHKIYNGHTFMKMLKYPEASSLFCEGLRFLLVKKGGLCGNVSNIVIILNGLESLFLRELSNEGIDVGSQLTSMKEYTSSSETARVSVTSINTSMRSPHRPSIAEFVFRGQEDQYEETIKKAFSKLREKQSFDESNITVDVERKNGFIFVTLKFKKGHQNEEIPGTSATLMLYAILLDGVQTSRGPIQVNILQLSPLLTKANKLGGVCLKWKLGLKDYIFTKNKKIIDLENRYVPAMVKTW